MPQPTLCMIHEAIGNQSAIAKVAAWGVRQALAAGWKVTVVAKLLDESLRGDVEWLHLTVPPRGFFVQWTTARHFITSALGGRTFDVIHAHQPQVASLSDVFQCHFLTRVAYERHCLESRPGLRPTLIRAQQQGVLHAEDYYYRRWNPRTRMLFCSELIRKEFVRLYGQPRQEQVLVNVCPPLNADDPVRRRAARSELIPGLDGSRIVVGFLGGLDERKGYRVLLSALEKTPEAFLLMGGQFTKGFTYPGLSHRMQAVGLVKDTGSFYDACDVLLVPSFFDPCPLVVLEAASHGVPIIATDGVGNLPELLTFGAGMRWDTNSALGPLVQNAVRERQSFLEGGRRMAQSLSSDRQGQRLLAVYADLLQEKSINSGKKSPLLELT